MGQFFDLFPKIGYDIAGNQYSNYEEVTNTFFRLRILREVLSNISSYHYHIVKDHETPEFLAEEIYGNPEAHWIILMANEIVDPIYDWPMNDRVFRNYISEKYGSIAAAQTGIHHYEKVIQRQESYTGIITETRFIINQTKLTNNDLDVPYDYYSGLAETQTVNTYNMGEGRTVTETVFRDDITYFDWEDMKNEERRTIKIIKADYYGQIMGEFDSLTDYAKIPFFRRLA